MIRSSKSGIIVKRAVIEGCPNKAGSEFRVIGEEGKF